MAKGIIKELRDFPSVEELLQAPWLAKTLGQLPRPVAADVVRLTMAEARGRLKQNKTPLPLETLHDSIKSGIDDYKRREMCRVINATGIVVHTNLGRAPLSESLSQKLRETLSGYCNVEFSLDEGKRGQRGAACEDYLAALAGAESATVVNNCAAALFLILNTLASRKEVIISRSELVQIGGGFRIPDILKKSGAKLCEIGTTNITTLTDYEKSINEKTGLILKVHKSNFVQKGFTEEVPLKALAALGKKNGVPVVNDLGSGVFVATKALLGYHEPTVQQSVRDDAALTCFSGDKMLGGCQAGLIVGRKEMTAQVKKNPLFRTMRVDKIVLTLLEHLFTSYLNDRWLTDIKLWSLLSVPEAVLYQRGKNLHKKIGLVESISVEATHAFVGGGALPEASIPSVGLVFSDAYKAAELFEKFKNLSLPIIGRIESDRFILDLKAVDDSDLPYLELSIKQILQSK